MIPRKDNELRVWADSFITQCDTNKTAWGIPADAVTGSRALCDTYMSALDIALAPDSHSKAATTAKNEAREALRHNLIAFIAQYIDYNNGITAPIRNNLGLPVRDTTRSPIPRPTTFPEFSLQVSAIRTLAVRFRVMGSAGKARPYGYNGAVIYYAVLDTPPKDSSELTHSLLATKTPYPLTFTEMERGKRVYIALAWQNEKGEKGPISQIEATFIP
jgi:hypothetical protein